MSATVFFATNRALTGPPDQLASYRNPQIVPPSDPAAMTFGTAFVDDANLTADTTGAILSFQSIAKGGFDAATKGDLGAAGRNLMVFLHGFDNSFEAAITRAAFNQQWMAHAAVAGAVTTVVAFAWPSLGEAVSFPIPYDAYKRDQNTAALSGLHLMALLAGLQPILAQVRANGHRTILLAHSMGNLALSSAVENWFAHGHGVAWMFDEVLLAAADEDYDSFGDPPFGGLSGLHRLTRRTSVYFSRADIVLQLSAAVNLGAYRMGQDGPQYRTDIARFPPAQYRMVDCSAVADYDFVGLNSHQYYRRSPTVRADIAGVMAGH